MNFVTRFNYKKTEGWKSNKPSMTQQHHKDDCDINKILKKYKKTGILPDLIKKNPHYGDFASVPSYQESMNTVILAQEQFAALPSHIRDKFQNDPVKFLEFANDPKSGDELVKMGLAHVKKEPSPIEVIVKNQPEVPNVPKTTVKTAD